ncbi:PAS domain-containing sensor histidine kinase [Hymenobacter gummosus]|nr:PAS domain-containing sensor histidine kinase [Hymenobacter gummosus]
MTNRPPRTAAELAQENEELRQRLHEAEDLIQAIRTGTIDALAVQAPDGPRVFTLQGADQSYRTLIEQMSEGALLLSQDATVLYCNAGLAALLGRPMEQLIGTSFHHYVPVECRPYWEGLLASSWTGRGRGEMPLETADGLLQSFALALNVLTFGDTPTLAVILTDLTDKREIQAIGARIAEQNAQLERQKEALRTQALAQRAAEQTAAETSRILEGIPHIAWTADPAGRSTYLNRRWFDYTGEAATPAGSELLRYLHPGDVPAVQASWARSLQGGAPLEMECRLRSAAGEYRWMLARALPSRNEQGDIIQWIGAYTDIHEHKLAQQRVTEAQEQLRASNEQLLRINHDLDNFIYTASHDLKAPINNIEGLLGALLAELPAELVSSPGVQPLVTMMQGSVDRFKRTIEHLTEVTRLQKEFEQPPAQVDLADIVREVGLDLAPELAATNTRLDVQLDGCPPLSFAEKNLRSIVYNLLSNAVKYHNPGRESWVRVGCRLEGAFLVLTVQDNGLGFNAAGNPKLFGMFQRFHDHVAGSGIGLYMIKRIIENAGGRIEVASEVGVGSTFSVYFRR